MNMFRLLTLLTIAISLAVFVLNFSKLMPEVTDAKVNFRFYCAQCHGLKGKGDGPNALKNMPVDPRDLTDAGAIGKLSDNDILRVIREGGHAPNRSTFMPPFTKTIPEIEIMYLKDYIRELCKC